MNIGAIYQLKNGLNISVDWLSFTVKKPMSYQTVIDFFGLNMKQFQTGLNGRYGYKSQLRHILYPISILYDGNDGMGIHVDVSGSAIGYFLHCYLDKNMICSTPFDAVAYEVDSFDSTVFADVLKDILDLGQITRLDLAVDDIGCQYYDLAELADIFKSGMYTSRFKQYQIVTSGGKGFTSGYTIYLGSRKSNLMLRIYDKCLEQKKKKKVVSVPWIRWELELHNERACFVASLLVTGMQLSEISLGILSNYLRLIEKDNVRDSRCSTSPKWLQFLDGIKKLKICQPIEEKTLNDKREWLVKQVAPTISAVYQADGDLSFIYDLIESGSSRLSAELLHIIQIANQGFSEGAYYDFI